MYSGPCQWQRLVCLTEVATGAEVIALAFNEATAIQVIRGLMRGFCQSADNFLVQRISLSRPIEGNCCNTTALETRVISGPILQHLARDDHLVPSDAPRISEISGHPDKALHIKSRLYPAPPWCNIRSATRQTISEANSLQLDMSASDRPAIDATCCLQYH